MHKHNSSQSHYSLAVHTTAHCLLGCGLGEIVGVIIGLALGLTAVVSLAIGVTLGFVFGFLLGIIPLVKAGRTPWEAFKFIFLGEFISIAVMETGEVLTQLYFPGVMEGNLLNPLFWLGMGASLLVGYIVAYPINYAMIKRGMDRCH